MDLIVTERVQRIARFEKVYVYVRCGVYTYDVPVVSLESVPVNLYIVLTRHNIARMYHAVILQIRHSYQLHGNPHSPTWLGFLEPARRRTKTPHALMTCL